VLVLCGDLALDSVARSHLVALSQVGHRIVDTPIASPRNRQIARDGGPSTYQYGVESGPKVVPLDVFSDLNGRAETRALGRHLLHTTVDVNLLHLKVGHAVSHQAAESVVLLVHRDRVASAGELLRCRQTRGSGAHNGDRPPGLARRLKRLHATAFESLVNDRDLDVLDGHRGLVDAQHATRFARRRANAAGKLREVVGRVQPVKRVVPLAAPYEVVPLRDEVAQRASLMAERDAAVHAASRLSGERLRILGEFVLDVLPVHQPHRHGTALGNLPVAVLQESTGVSHQSPPRSLPTHPAPGGLAPRRRAPRVPHAHERTERAGCE